MSQETIAILVSAAVTIVLYWIKSQSDLKAAEASNKLVVDKVDATAAQATTEVKEIAVKVEGVQKNNDGHMTSMMDEIKQLRQQIASRAQHDLQTAADVIHQARAVGIMPVAVVPLPVPPSAPAAAATPVSVKQAAVDAIQAIEGVAAAVEEVPQKTTDLVVEKIKEGGQQS